jgi:benzoate-CoA ligase
LHEGVKEEPMLGQEIREWLRSRLAAYKCPQEIRFVSELPKTATGKIQRFRLRGSSTP